MTRNIEIEVCERMGDWWIDHEGKEQPKYHAQVKGHPGYWSCGRTRAEAIGDLVSSHPELFLLVVKHLGREPR